MMRPIALAFAAVVASLLISGSSAAQVWSLAHAPASFLGNGARGGAGRVWSVGDLNEDGTPDLAVSAPMEDTDAPDGGRIYLFSGDTPLHRNMSLLDADVVITGAASSDLLGWAVTGVGDVNDDGQDDLLVSALLDREDDASGTVYLFFGPWGSWGATVDVADADVTVYAEHLTSGAGGAMAAAGDVDGDGIGDLWIGAQYSLEDPSNPAGMELDEYKIGRIHLLLGRQFWPATLKLGIDSHLWITGETLSGQLGAAIGAGRDISGDGLPDLCVGSPPAKGPPDLFARGRFDCFIEIGDLTPGEHFTAEARFSIWGPGEGSMGGWSVALADVDCDGIADVIAAAPFAEDEQFVQTGGAVTGYPGGATLPVGLAGWGVGLFNLRGSDDFGALGYDLANLGDVTGDGCEDLLIAAPGASGAEYASGRIFLLEGRPIGEGWPMHTDQLGFVIEGEFELDRSGIHVASLGEIGYGYPAFLAGSNHSNHGGDEAGKAYLLHLGMSIDDDGDGYTELEGDCQDDDPQSHPGAAVDEDRDDDCDGFTEAEGDCDDECANCFPDAPEIPDGLDNDCDGDVDEALPETDEDGDGWSLEDGDCDDSDDEVYPGAEEVCNDIDDNCNGMLDEDDVCDDGDDDSAADDDSADDDQTPPVDDDDDCSCSSAPEPRVGPLVLLLVLAAALGSARRRRSDGDR